MAAARFLHTAITLEACFCENQALQGISRLRSNLFRSSRRHLTSGIYYASLPGSPAARERASQSSPRNQKGCGTEREPTRRAKGPGNWRCDETGGFDRGEPRQIIPKL
ncbi:hypothetical protein [Pseudaminobacter salicylatoxidans]|uniref:hypothetical protein n=1 Tax=Pseudaminobacter salicylatoxidans TaxID=93369 RepID=UPI0011B250B7|nr:hypothetical protein [Pseudaminobacter salicylatoxidans]